jgi:hypothetical protein
MTQGVLNKRLTVHPLVAILFVLSPHVAARFCSRKNHKMPVKARLLHGLRYSMQVIIYGGRCLGGESLHGSLAMSTNPNNVHRPKFGSFKRCSLTLQESAHHVTN